MKFYRTISVHPEDAPTHAKIALVNLYDHPKIFRFMLDLIKRGAVGFVKPDMWIVPIPFLDNLINEGDKIWAALSPEDKAVLALLNEGEEGMDE